MNAKRKDGKNDVFYNPAQVHMLLGDEEAWGGEIGWFWCLTL